MDWDGIFDDRGVSPVVGVALIVVIVAILATLVGAAALQIGSGSATQPASQAPITVEENRRAAVVQVHSTLDFGGDLEIRVNGKRVVRWEEFHAGQQRRVNCLTPGDRIQVVSKSDSGDRSNIVARHTIQRRTDCAFEIENGGSSKIVSPVNWGGSTSGTEFYSYGATDGTGHPHAHMDGTYTESGTSYMFFYEYNGNMALVVVHDKPDTHGGHGPTDAVSGTYPSGDSGGGKVTMTFHGLPTSSGDWVVKDDGGDFSCGGENKACWSWVEAHTDGGIFSGGLSAGSVSIEVEPVMWGSRDGGTITKWRFMTGTDTGPAEITLDMSKNVSITRAS